MEGSPYPVQVLSDHKNLTYFRTAQKLTRRQARWGMFLSLFDLQLAHVPGTHMIQSDILSRLAHLNTEISDSEDRILLPDHWFINSIDVSLQDRIKACTDIDPIVRDALVAIRKGSLPPMRSALADWKEQDGLVLFKNRCYVPPNLALRQDILKRYHDAVTTFRSHVT